MSDRPGAYGFLWGPMEVERSCHVEGRGYALTIRTDHQEMQVYVSEKGRVIEAYPVHRRTKKQLEPPE